MKLANKTDTHGGHRGWLEIPLLNFAHKSQHILDILTESRFEDVWKTALEKYQSNLLVVRENFPGRQFRGWYAQFIFVVSRNTCLFCHESHNWHNMNDDVYPGYIYDRERIVDSIPDLCDRIWTVEELCDGPQSLGDVDCGGMGSPWVVCRVCEGICCGICEYKYLVNGCNQDEHDDYDHNHGCLSCLNDVDPSAIEVHESGEVFVFCNIPDRIDSCDDESE
jgi:hypothetical protein